MEIFCYVNVLISWMALAVMKSDREHLFHIFLMDKLLLFLKSVLSMTWSHSGGAIFVPGILGEAMSF